MGSETSLFVDEALDRLLKERMPLDRARLLEALAKSRQMRAWVVDAGLPADMREYLGTMRTAQAVELIDLLLDWIALGGRVELVAPDATSESAPDVAAELPPPAPEPAPPVPQEAPVPASAPVPEAPPPAPRVDTAEPLRALVRDLATSRTPLAEVAFLLSFVRDTVRLNAVAPPRARLDALAYAVARMRHLSEMKLAREEEDLVPCLSMATSYARNANIGAVYGPSRTHMPRKGSWAADAADLLLRLAEEVGVDLAPPNPEKSVSQLQRLVSTGGADSEIRELVLRCFDAGVSGKDVRLIRILEPVLHALDGKRFKDIRAAVRAAIAEDSDADDATPSARVPADWPYWHLTRGKRAVMVGGESREPNRQRIQDAFGFSSLTWAETEYKKRELLALRESVVRGGVDMLIHLTAFVGHDADDILMPACRESGVPFVPVHTGYGIVGIRTAIERFGAP